MDFPRNATCFHLPPPARRRGGFSLLELLVVIAIIAMVAALMLPSLNPAMGASQLSQAALLLSNQLNMARQAALTKNRPVEVRLYKFGDSDALGEKANEPATGKYRAVQMFEMKENGTALPLEKITRLPTAVIVDSGETLSTLLAKTEEKTWTALDPQISLPRVGKNYICKAFQFYPDSSTSLTPTKRWHLTLHGIRNGDGLTAAPKNFACILIDPGNGHTQVFRP